MGGFTLQFGDSVVGADEWGVFTETVGGGVIGDSYYMGWKEGGENKEMVVDNEEEGGL